MDIFDTDDDLGASTVGRYAPERVHRLEERIAELEVEAENAKTYMVNLSKTVTEVVAENQRLREAVQAVVQERSWNAIDKAEALLKEGGDE